MKVGQFTEELTEQMEDAAQVTSKAYANLKRIRHMETGDSGGSSSVSGTEAADEALRDKKKDNEKGLAAEIAIVQPIFRFFQLLCENHNLELQVGFSHCLVLKLKSCC
jgi:hypothetical protein